MKLAQSHRARNTQGGDLSRVEGPCQDPPSSSTHCPDNGPQLRGSTHAPEALGSQGFDSRQSPPHDATFPTCSQKKAHGGWGCWTPAELTARPLRPSGDA